MQADLEQKCVKLVVLGDIGRSPRMQYHALSLAQNGFKVKIISYSETKPLTELLENSNISFIKLQPLRINAGPQIVQYVLKAFWQAISLFITLIISGKCSYLLCQNPPAIPSLPICRFYCLITNTKFIIDWHNYAYSIMSLSLPKDNFLLKISKRIEKYFGQSSNSNICVTYAMKEDLMINWNIDATVLHDKPPHIFHPISLEEKHSWFIKLGQQFPEFLQTQQVNEQSEDDISFTACTKSTNGEVELLECRPGILFSSTSWTPDEDFNILLEALQNYETTYTVTKLLPKLICVITGKGPMKEHYMEQIASRNWQHVKVIMPWLEAADYPTMVASSDLGVCLHTSSSGLDLPMKVVDMFGSGLPVCAVDFKCLHELVYNGDNGYTFKDSNELSKLIISWFKGFPLNSQQNKIVISMKKELEKFQAVRWEQNWNLRAKKFFENRNYKTD